MNKGNTIEDFFCKQFINSGYQDRFFFELSSNKKRVKAISRICHNMMDIINENKIVEVYNSTDLIHLTDRLRELSKEKEGYCIGFFELDQKWADISEAINAGIQSNFGFAIILSDEQYIMIVIICHWFWFERYYLISKEEYDWFDSAIQKLDDLAHDCYKQGVKHPRFYYSELEYENTTEQVTNLRTLLTNSRPTE